VLRVLEIGGIAPLIAVDGVKQRTVPIELQVRDIELTTEIPLPGTLDLDNLRAEVRKP
jgi:hypothetical protein